MQLTWQNSTSSAMMINSVRLTLLLLWRSLRCFLVAVAVAVAVAVVVFGWVHTLNFRVRHAGTFLEFFFVFITFVFRQIPMASTCFNMLKLTSYSSEKHLKDKLLIAIRHGAEGFSFGWTTAQSLRKLFLFSAVCPVWIRLNNIQNERGHSFSVCTDPTFSWSLA